MLNLSQEVIEVKLILLDFLLQALCFLFIVLFLSTFYQRYDITHSQYTVSHTGRMELIYCIQFFTGTDKLNRFVYHRTDRQSRTTTCITIQLRQYYTIEVQTFIEFTCRIHGILSGHRINDKQCFIRIDSILNRFNLIHHLFIDSQTTCCIDNNQIISFCLCFLNGIQCNLYRILAFRFAIHRYFNLLSQHLQLFDCSRTINVTSNQQRLTVLFHLQHASQLSGECSLTGTLQT